MAKGPSIKLVREIVRLGRARIPTVAEAWMRDHFTDLKKEPRPIVPTGQPWLNAWDVPA